MIHKIFEKTKIHIDENAEMYFGCVCGVIIGIFLMMVLVGERIEQSYKDGQNSIKNDTTLYIIKIK